MHRIGPHLHKRSDVTEITSDRSQLIQWHQSMPKWHRHGSYLWRYLSDIQSSEYLRRIVMALSLVTLTIRTACCEVLRQAHPRPHFCATCLLHDRSSYQSVNRWNTENGTIDTKYVASPTPARCYSHESSGVVKPPSWRVQKQYQYSILLNWQSFTLANTKRPSEMRLRFAVWGKDMSLFLCHYLLYWKLTVVLRCRDLDLTETVLVEVKVVVFCCFCFVRVKWTFDSLFIFVPLPLNFSMK